MIHHPHPSSVRLCILLLSLQLAACAPGSVLITPSPTATVAPLPSPTSTEASQPSPSPTREDLTAQIDRILIFLTERESFTGSVLVAREGEILLSWGYGLANRDSQIPNTPQTKYRLASVTKQFTAMAILILQANGQLNVQHQICDYVPDCPSAWQALTIHHLLIHTSGIPNVTEFDDFQARKATPSAPEQTVAWFKDSPLEFSPGSQWRYSNSGYVLLGYIIEQVSGRSYEAFVQQNIFEPLQMRDSGYDHNDGSLATGYTGLYSQWEEPDYIDMSIPHAAGALYSTVEDLYRWDQALYTEQLVPQELLELMFTPHAKITGTDLSYGYGWLVGELTGHPTVSHSGGIEGFATEIRRYPEAKVTIIVLSNRDTTNVGDIMNQIAQLVLER